MLQSGRTEVIIGKGMQNQMMVFLKWECKSLFVFRGGWYNRKRKKMIQERNGQVAEVMTLSVWGGSGGILAQMDGGLWWARGLFHRSRKGGEQSPVQTVGWILWKAVMEPFWVFFLFHPSNRKHPYRLRLRMGGRSWEEGESTKWLCTFRSDWVDWMCSVGFYFSPRMARLNGIPGTIVSEWAGKWLVAFAECDPWNWDYGAGAISGQGGLWLWPKGIELRMLFLEEQSYCWHRGWASNASSTGSSMSHRILSCCLDVIVAQVINIVLCIDYMKLFSKL